VTSFSKYIIVLLFTLSSVHSFCQNPTHFVLGEKEFTNTNIYTLLYDDTTDILYVGTNSGLFAYQQNTFIELQRLKEQRGNSLFQLKQNHQGEVFCCNLSGQIFKVDNGKMELFYEAPKKEIGTTFYYFFDEENNLLTVSKSIIRRVKSTGEKEILFAGKSGNSRFSSARQTVNGDIYFSCHEGFEDFKYTNGRIDSITNSKGVKQGKPLKYFSLENNVFAISDNGKVVCTANTIDSNFKEKHKEQLFYINKKEIIGLDAKKGGRILGIQDNMIVEKTSFFNNLFLSTAFANTKGTLFLGTFGEGIIIIPNKKVVQQIYDDHLFLGIAVSPNNELYLTTRGGDVFKHSDAGLKLLDKRAANVDNIHYVEGDYAFKNIGFSHILYDTYIQPNGVIFKDIYQVDDQTLLYADQIGVDVIFDSEKLGDNNLHFLYKTSTKNGYRVIENKRCAAITWNPIDRLIYYASNLGVYSKEWSSSKTDSILWKGKSFLSNDLEFYNNQLICGTVENGVLFFDNNQFITQLSKKEGLKSNTIKKLLINDDLLYILTNLGIQVYSLQERAFLGLGTAEGMVNKGITNFDVSNDKLWLLEKHSYYSVDLSAIQSENSIAKLHIDSVVVNDSVINTHIKNKFKYNENAVSFYFDYRDIESKTETKIQYQLEGFNNDWKTISSSENKIEYQSLPVGEYTFTIKAVYRNQESASFLYSFEILPPYWQQWWFYLLIGFSTALVITIIALYRIQIIRKKNQQKLKHQEIEKNAINAQLKALRAQMNPHFIFNVINSIQDLVLQQETIKSYDYLVVFSKLVRNTLDYSEREFISLKEEIAFLEVYLSLEKLRFKDDFKYMINCKSDKIILIPSLIIQPFIENAIKHGLLHKAGEKTLTVNFIVKEQLICEIIDNGVGREESEKIKKAQNRRHHSFSTQAIKERMQMLSTQYSTEVNYQIIDLKKENGEALGTKVVINLPYNINVN